MSKVNWKPEGYHTLTPYLIVKDAAKAIDFYTKALGAKELFRLQMPDGVLGHCELKIGDSIFMMADEFPNIKALSPKTLGGSAVNFLIYVENVDIAGKKVEECGMKVLKPIVDQIYGDRSGTYEDPFGYCWTLATHIKDVSHAEVQEQMNKNTPQ